MQLFHRSRAEHKDHDTPYSCPPPSGLLEEIELAKREMNDAYNHFQSASDPGSDRLLHLQRKCGVEKVPVSDQRGKTNADGDVGFLQKPTSPSALSYVPNRTYNRIVISRSVRWY